MKFETKTFGETVKVLRALKGVGVTEASKQAGVAFVTLHGIESGVIKFPTKGIVDKIAAYFEIDPEILHNHITEDDKNDRLAKQLNTCT